MREWRASLYGWLPRYWRGEAGPAGTVLDVALWPAEVAFRSAVALRNLAYAADLLPTATAAIPVVSFGNLTVGGTGKTPLTAWAAARLREGGARPAVVLRGYGGDEALVHRELNPEVPVFVASDRALAVREAREAGCEIAVVDDGFQHRRLHRELDVVLLAAESWVIPPRLLPRGAWREPLDALRRADHVVVTRRSDSDAPVRELAAWAAERLGPRRVAVCHLAPGRLEPLAGGVPIALEDLRGEPVTAVSSIAVPGAFQRQVAGAGARVAPMPFPDHHAYTARDVRRIVERTAFSTLVTTRKDAVKLRPLLGGAARVFVLEQRVVFEAGEAELRDALRSVVGR